MATMAERFVPMPKMDPFNIDRFQSFIGPGPGDCLNWLGFTQSGYGRIRMNGGQYIATRLAYFIAYKVDPGQLMVCHECNNPLCVNHEHLYLGTNSENIKQAFLDGRNNHRGINSPNSKLTEEIVKRIRLLRDNGWTYEAIVTDVKIASKASVADICKRRSWKHIR